MEGDVHNIIPQTNKGWKKLLINIVFKNCLSLKKYKNLHGCSIILFLNTRRYKRIYLVIYMHEKINEKAAI